MAGFRSKLKKSFLHIFKEVTTTSIQKRLGYPENTRLLIIHADDLGLSSSENEATFEAFEKGMVNSGSVMIPCNYVKQVAEYGKAHPLADIGIHLTLTNEWDTYKWGPVTSPDEVKSLVNSNGYFRPDKTGMVKAARSTDIEKELRAQIDSALRAGIDVTHLDSHMFVLFSGKVLRVCYRLAKEYKLPLLLTNDLPVRYTLPRNAIVVDNLYYARAKDYKAGIANYYRQSLRSMKPGLNCIIVHLAYDNDEMKNLTGSQTIYGSGWRQTDFDFFTSDECRRLIDDNNIKLVTWREIRDKLLR